MKRTVMTKRGRPTKLTAQMRRRILDELRDGRVLREICQATDMPDRVTIYGWMRADPELGAAVRRAREEGADALAENALAIADAAGPVPGDVAKARLRADVRLKLAAAWNAAYGNRPNVQITHEASPITFGLSAEKMAQLANLIRPLIEGQVIDVTPRTLAPPLRGSSTPPMRRS